MGRKDWLVPLMAALIGVLGALSGSWVTGYQYERAADRQAKIDTAKQLATERAAELNNLKETGLRYIGATDALVHSLVLSGGRDKPLAEQLAEHMRLVQSAGNELALIADDELAQQTRTLSQATARLLAPSAKPMELRLVELNGLALDWIKLFKRNLTNLKAQSDEALGLRASVQVAAPLKR
jgi:hypothetical protein